MGAYSPAPVVTPEIHRRAMQEVIEPTLRGMAADGIQYTGFLYAGLMITPDGRIKTLEFNCRMGDPETQPIMMRLRSDLAQVLLAGANGQLNGLSLDWDERVALGVVLAAHGYPLSPRKGDAITGLPQDNAQTMVFHAGTQSVNGQVLTAGGRVLCVTTLAASVAQAREQAQAVIQGIAFDGMQHRRDIGHRAL
jgi:phosphoribosylamine--glycine ligase